MEYASANHDRDVWINKMLIATIVEWNKQIVILP